MRRFPVVREILPGGSVVLVQRVVGSERLAIRAVWPGGVEREEPRTAGASKLVASLLTAGTSSLSATALARTQRALGVRLQGAFGRGSLGLRAEGSARRWSRVLGLVAECLLRPSFPAWAIAPARRAALRRVAQLRGDPRYRLFRAVERALAPRGGRRLPVEGTAEGLWRLDRRALRRHYLVHRRAPLVVAIVGDVPPARVLARARQLFGTASARATAGPAATLPPRSSRAQTGSPRWIALPTPADEARVAIAFPIPGVASADSAALDAWSEILSGRAGRRWLPPFAQVGLAAHFDAFVVQSRAGGYFVATATVSARRGQQVAAEMCGWLDRVARNPPGPGVLARVKHLLISRRSGHPRNLVTIAANLAFNEAYGLGYGRPLRYVASIKQLTRAALGAVSRRYFTRRQRVVIVASPSSTAPSGEAPR